MVEKMDTGSTVIRIEELILNAADASDSHDAMRFSQAACNAANALTTLSNIENAKLPNPIPLPGAKEAFDKEGFEIIKSCLQSSDDAAWRLFTAISIEFTENGFDEIKSRAIADRFMRQFFDVSMSGVYARMA